MVRANNQFDKKLETQRDQLPSDLIEAAVYVHDTLDIAQAAAQSYFGVRPSNDMILAVYDRIAAKHDQLRGANAESGQD